MKNRLLEWDYSRNQGSHTAFVVQDKEERQYIILQTDNRMGIVNSEIKKAGYDLYMQPHGKGLRTSKPIAHAKTVKLLKEEAQRLYDKAE